MGIDTFNQDFYKKQPVADNYSKNYNFLWPEEKLIFKKYEQYIEGKTVLDIGCGGGRTAPALNDLSKYYTGIDYSNQMVEACRKKHKTLKFVHGDASDMFMMNNDQFDFVLFSFNGIDSMSHEKRIKTLKEIYRVLKRDGVFVFSSHNRDDRKIVTSFNKYDWSITRNVRNICSYMKARKHQIRSEAYTILSDPLAGFGCMTYYIRKGNQVEQLENVGFEGVEIISRKAQFVEVDSPDTDCQFFHYVCRKPKLEV